MITIPLFIALFFFFACIAIFFLFFFLNIYHLAASASLTPSSFFATVVVCAIAGIVLFGAWTLLQDTDWQKPIVSMYAPF